MKYTKPIALTLYALALGYSFGLFLDTLVAPLPWPYDVIIGYALGAFFGFFISFELLAKWRTKRTTKVVVAAMLLTTVYCVGTVISGLALQMTRHSLILDFLQNK